MSLEVNLYYANWCSHCQRFKPEWELIKTKLDEHGISHNEYEDSVNKNAIEEAEVAGFPTIRIVKDNAAHEYTGARTAADLLSYLNITPTQQGGGSTSYHDKYLKYKAKYLHLKKLADEQS